MKKQDKDRRTQKTLQSIHEALITLMMEKAYNKITVQDIIDTANVGRSTFYSHFQSKDEVLTASMEHLMESLNRHVKHPTVDQQTKARLIPVTELFEHVQENIRLMKALIKASSVDMFFDKAQGYWNKKLEEYLKSQLPEGSTPKVPLPIMVSHITSTLVFLLKWWVENKMPYSASQMDEYFQELIHPSIQNVIG